MSQIHAGHIRTTLFLVLFILFGVIIIPQHVVYAATLGVNSTADVVLDDGQCTLREAVIAANTDTASGVTPGECVAGTGPDTIILPNGTYTLGTPLPQIIGDINFTGEDQALTIIQGAAAPGAVNYRGLNIAVGVNVVITDLTIRNFGNAAGPADGGGIQNRGALTIINSVLSGNSASVDGGVIYNWGTGSIDIINSTLTNNSAPGAPGNGGGIHNNNGTITITNSTLSNNTAAGNGGGVYQDGGTVTITNSTLSGNVATGAGAGIYNLAGTVAIADSTVTSNTAQNGGGIYNFGTLTLENSTVSNNTVGNGGGGIWNTVTGTANITNSTVSGNQASNYGAGIQNNGTVTIDASELSGNVATNAGGGISNGGPLTVTASTLSGNSAGLGGAFTNGDTATIINSTLSSNSSTGMAGGIYNGNTLNLINSTVASNSATVAGGGGGLWNDGGAAATVTNSIIANSPTGGDCLLGAPLVTGGANISSDLTCAGFSMTGTNPQLGPLTDNGGPTQTHALLLLPLSPAIDASGAGATTTDQRGAAAVGIRDIGAFEANAALVSLSFNVDYTTIYEEAAAGPTVATVTVTLDNLGGAPAGTVTVYITRSGTATEGVSVAYDYQLGGTPLPLTFNAANWPTPGNSATQTITFMVWNDTLVEPPEIIDMEMSFTGPASIGGPNRRTVTIIGDEVLPPTPTVSTTGPSGESESVVTIFDPAISKIGFLQPGQFGLVGEQIEWVVTASNNGSASGFNVVITDTLRPELQIDAISSNVISSISGQTVTITIPVLNPGQSVTFSIYTTILMSDVTVDNTACLTVDDSKDLVCVTTPSINLPLVRELPSTGETPRWAQWLRGLLMQEDFWTQCLIQVQRKGTE